MAANSAQVQSTVYVTSVTITLNKLNNAGTATITYAIGETQQQVAFLPSELPNQAFFDSVAQAALAVALRDIATPK